MNTENKEEDFFGNTIVPNIPIPEKTPESVFGSTETKTIDVVKPIEVERIQEPETFKVSKLGNEIPKVPTTGVDIPPEFKDVIDRINLTYEMLPNIDYNSIYTELSTLGIRPTTGYIPSEIGRQLEQVQGAKDRVSEIFILVDRHCVLKKACVTTLKNVWYKFCTKTNKEQREGEASYLMHNYMLDFAKIEALESTCKHIWANLESTHKILQNKISIMQITVKLDYGTRSSNADYDFGRSSQMAKLNQSSNSNNNDLNTSNNTENETISTPEVEECSF